MKQLVKLPRQARWALPAGIVATVAGVVTASTISSVTAAPQLPPRTPTQLLAGLAGRTSPPVSGTVVETASLGLPTLPSTVGPLSLASLLTGSHTIDVWYSDPAHYRLAIPQRASESDLIRDGRNVWLWGSSANMVTHVVVPAGGEAALPSLPLTPQQAASEVLAKMGPDTAVSVDDSATVAGEAAYQLVLTPKSPGSLIGQVRIAIDSVHHTPLRVQVYAKGATSPDAQIGFTSVSFGKPPAATFAFRPPAGAAVVSRNPKSSGSAGDGQAPGAAGVAGAGVIGNGWLAVSVLPESSLAGLAAAPPSARSAGPAIGPLGSSSASVGPQPGGSGLDTLGIGIGPVFNAMLQSATRVSGPWGSGRLLRTDLVSLLVTSKGRVLIGAVTPDVLYRAATQTARVPDTGRHGASVPAASR